MAQRHKRPRAKQFPVARLSLWLATIVLAGFGAVGWGMSLWETSPALAATAALVAAVAPLVAASLAGPATHGGGIAAWLCIIIFTAMDAGSNANAVWAFDAQANAAVNRPAQEAYEAERKALIAARDTAAANLAALPTPDAQGAIRKLDTYTATHAALTATLAAAQGRVDDLEPPKAATLFPRELSGVVMALTSFALILGHLAVNAASRKSAEQVASQVDQKPRGKRKRKPQRKAQPVTEPQGNVTPIRRPPRGPIN